MSLQGTLKTLGITEVLEFLAARNATGQLDVTTEMGTAVYLFSDGDVAQSEYSFIHERGTDSAEATYYVVSELDGTFFFDEDQEPLDVDGSEDVGSVLGRTADIAEKWHEVEDVIATPNHLLVRNTELDGSVTIQPEWWKTLEVIGEGKTSLQVAKHLEMGVLDASLLVLAMTHAGLLNVENIDPLSMELPAVGDLTDQLEVVPDAPTEEAHDAGMLAHEFDAVEPTLAAEPAAVAEVVPEPVAEAAPELAPEVSRAPVVEVAHEPVVEMAPPVEVADPIAEVAQAPAEMAPTPQIAEAVTEVAPAPIEVAPAPAPIAEVAPVPVVDEDDGWASDHSRAYQTPAQPEPVAPLAAVPDLPAAAPVSHELAPMPAPEPAPVEHGAADVFSSHPVEEPVAPAPIQEAYDAGTASTDMAGEVLNDLATLSGQLDGVEQEANWELDGTFVTDSAPQAPQADADPFGDLGELLIDSEDDEDRGSVLKFLRRD